MIIAAHLYIINVIQVLYDNFPCLILGSLVSGILVKFDFFFTRNKRV